MDRYRERSALTNDKIKDRGGQWGPRNVRISLAKSEPHTARRQWRVIARNLWEIGMNVIPRINKWSAFTVWVALHFFLVGMVRLRIHSLLAYVTRGKRSEDNPFSFMVRGALAFRRRYCAGIWPEKANEGVWGSGEERENEREFWEGRRSFCLDYKGTPS